MRTRARVTYQCSPNTVNLQGSGGSKHLFVTNNSRLTAMDCENAKQALTLDPTFGLAQAALAVPHFMNWRGSEAKRYYRTQASDVSSWAAF